ncbi:MAG: hypothetical protein KC413_22965, partial [Anaerolineales bacterium]|nr:hypothetical protein [Anaerolineales bacterium]
TAANGGGIYVSSSGVVTIGNTIVAFNTGGTNDGIFVDGGTSSGAYNNIFDDNSNATLTNAITGNPDFVNRPASNYRISSDSPNKDTGNPATPASVNIDFENQIRPNGSGIDVGADEYYPDIFNFSLTPETSANNVDRGTDAIFTHVLNNIGTADDSYTFTCATDPFWSVVNCPNSVAVASGATTNVQTTIHIPGSATALSNGRTIITATSVTSPTLFQRVIVDSTVNPQPGVNFTSNYTQTVLPGATITYTHILTNTGDADDTFTISLITGEWAELLPSNNFALFVPQGESRLVRVRITVPPYAPAGLADVTQIRATSGYNTAVFATVIDNISAKPTIGTRYVRTGGTDTDNNCTQISTANGSPG